MSYDLCTAVCTYGAIPRTTETELETEIHCTTETEPETELEAETDTEPETETGTEPSIYVNIRNYMFVHTRYLLRLSVRILLGRMAFPLPPKI